MIVDDLLMGSHDLKAVIDDVLRPTPIEKPSDQEAPPIEKPSDQEAPPIEKPPKTISNETGPNETGPMELKSKSSQNRVPKQSLREDMSTERQAKNKKKQTIKISKKGW